MDIGAVKVTIYIEKKKQLHIDITDIGDILVSCINMKNFNKCFIYTVGRERAGGSHNAQLYILGFGANGYCRKMFSGNEG